MTRFSLSAILPALLAAAPALVSPAAATPAVATSTRPGNAPPPVVIPHAEAGFDVAADGTYVSTYRVEIRVANDAAAKREGQQVFGYSPALEDLTVTEAATHKADGRVLPVDPASIHDQIGGGPDDIALITDRHERVLVFPDVAGGDTLVYAVRRNVRRPALPGRFLTSVFLGRAVPFKDYTLTIRAPASLSLYVEAHDFSATEERQGGTIIRRWHGSAEPGTYPVLGAYDRLPRVFVSTVPDWATFAREYGALTHPHEAITPAIRALADKVAGTAPDRREQVRRLYDWVSVHIRYVAVYLDAGALEPHDADTVLAHGWGDCKDHVVLLNALLAARGIPAELVAVNSGSTYSLSDPPTFAQLNHAITYVPELDLYLDSTAASAPFGTLPFSEYGKPAIHLVSSGPALRRIPAAPAEPAVTSLRTQSELKPDGAITGTTITTAAGPFAVELRRDAAWIEATGPADAAAQQLRALGAEGEGRFLGDAPDAGPEADRRATISGTFSLEARPELLEGDSFAPPAGLRLLARLGDGLLGPLGARALPDSEPTPCHPGRQVEELAITLPPSRHVVRLPRDVTLENAAARFHATWTLNGAILTHRRELESKVAGPVCEGALRHDAAAALDIIRRDQRTQVALSDE